MKKALLVTAIFAAAVVVLGAGYGYRQHSAIAQVAEQITIRIADSFAIESSPGITYKELGERLERYLAVADDKMLELRALNAGLVPTERAFVAAYVEAAQVAWRTKAAMYQAHLQTTNAHMRADQLSRGTSGAYGYAYAVAARSTYDAAEQLDAAAMRLTASQSSHISALRRLQEISAAAPWPLSSDVASAATIDAAIKRVDLGAGPAAGLAANAFRRVATSR